ncbi:hypothetical protein ACWT_6263 [Actinoplanes sp. SE50]|uniref:hypothetical protein n=1 Tax=unclassified Actinoplanes TaxID=2626549 RepID=UPI00023ED133|nr:MULTISPECIES: hypothetical protein [unclassified Actinoplanes]AEV87278.1 hypothetical protein ACPL_6396 [Actinoplanes sp. SE50/110]ATO85678.1 hypothetical protein ACWT_6263 [Actinoplanes sp. SE50]SLM03091.1 hypothetical protein ACSP50_6380 [Actinoplanes sp. SE50/110]
MGAPAWRRTDGPGLPAAAVLIPGGAGYRFAQGFHFARPMPAEDIAPLLGDPSRRESR